MKLNTQSTVYQLVLCALFAALAAVGAFIKIPLPYVPITMQILFTTLAGIILGPKFGTISIAVYVAIGLCGIPVFTQGGGPWYVLKPSFGYLIGFIAGTFVTGLIAHTVAKPGFWRLLLASLAGLMVIYFFGVLHLYLITAFYTGSYKGFWNLIYTGFIIFLPGDLISCAACALLGKKLVPILSRKKLAS